MGKPGDMRELDLRIPVAEHIGEGLLAVPGGAELEVELRLESLHDGILATANVDAPVEGQCSRCLTDIRDVLGVEFTELFAYAGDEALEYEVRDDCVDLEPPIRDAVVLALPFQPVCEPDCLGLDPTTGEKLTAPLEAPVRDTDPRWSALLDYPASPSAPTSPNE